MPIYNDQAILLRRYDLAESDRIVSFFGRRYGKVRVVAKGSKKLKSRFAGRLEPFHKVDISFFGKENTSLFKLSSVDFSKTNTELASDINKIFRATYLTEMVEAGLRDGDPNPKAFEVVTKALDWFDRQKTGRDFEWMTRFFDIQFLSALGYRPTLDSCTICRREWSGENEPLFDASAGGLLCGKCGKGKPSANPLTIGAAKFLKRITESDFDMAERLKPSAPLLKEIENSVTSFRNARLGTLMKSERFLS